MDFEFCTLNVASLAQKNKEDALNAIKHIERPKTAAHFSSLRPGDYSAGN